jgi:hypothetical protein
MAYVVHTFTYNCDIKKLCGNSQLHSELKEYHFVPCTLNIFVRNEIKRIMKLSRDFEIDFVWRGIRKAITFLVSD